MSNFTSLFLDSIITRFSCKSNEQRKCLSVWHWLLFFLPSPRLNFSFLPAIDEKEKLEQAFF